MRTRRPNHRLAKIHRAYTVEETSSLFGVHRNTVRAWIKSGLPTSDAKRPTLILGRELVAFLKARRLKNKKPCRPGQLYCVRCRVPQNPAGDMADCKPRSGSLGDLVGICPTCASMMYRRINLTKLEGVRGKLDISFPEGDPRIDDSERPSVNSDFKPEASGHDNAQPR